MHYHFTMSFDGAEFDVIVRDGAYDDAKNLVGLAQNGCHLVDASASCQDESHNGGAWHGNDIIRHGFKYNSDESGTFWYLLPAMPTGEAIKYLDKVYGFDPFGTECHHSYSPCGRIYREDARFRTVGDRLLVTQ